MIDIISIFSIISLIIWIYLIAFRGRFWLSDRRLNNHDLNLDNYPKVRAVIPARDEADVLPISLKSLLEQDYRGELSVVLVDDQSTDGTGKVALELAEKTGKIDRVRVIDGRPLPPGWTGKLWAMKQGIDTVENAPAPEYYLFTDADIEHDRSNLTRLVEEAIVNKQALVSLMVLLRSDSFWEKFLIPAFVFFFEKLYPFPLVNNPESKIAAAAGGCILIRRDILENIGGIDILKETLIDDCSLAIAVKKYIRKHPEYPYRSIWLGLTRTTLSLRPYDDLDSIWNMVARTAYTQLNYSPLLLLGTIIGMFITYLAAPIGLLLGAILNDRSLIIINSLTWLLMAVSYIPTLKLYGLSSLRGFGLPAIALLYSLMTVDSALRYRRGSGGAWKGRVYSG